MAELRGVYTLNARIVTKTNLDVPFWALEFGAALKLIRLVLAHCSGSSAPPATNWQLDSNPKGSVAGNVRRDGSR